MSNIVKIANFVFDRMTKDGLTEDVSINAAARYFGLDDLEVCIAYRHQYGLRTKKYSTTPKQPARA